MEREELESKIAKIHDAIIRLEPFCEDVKSLKSSVYGNGKIGIRTQVYILWGAFSIFGALVISVVAKQ